MQQHLTITMFGEFSITNKDHTITDQMNRSKKIWTLLGFLLLHKNHAVPYSDLIDLLWADSTSKDPSNSLKVLIHRVRGILDALELEDDTQCIVYYQDRYGWNPDIPCEIDTELFEDACKKAAATTNEDERLKYLMHAILLYKGEFLKKLDDAPWIMQASHYYATKFLKASADAAEILFRKQLYDELIDICRKALAYSPYDETFYIYLLKALVQTNQIPKAIQQYQQFSEVFFKEFGVSPSDEVTAIYKDIVKKNHGSEMDLSIIKQRLDESYSSGAILCDYDIFRAFYQQKARSAARNGESTYVMLLSVLNSSGEDIPHERVLEHVMPHLQHSIISTLRRGDIVTQFSPNQFLILLPGTTFESAELVSHRLKQAYRKHFPLTAITLQHSAQPVNLPELQNR